MFTLATIIIAIVGYFLVSKVLKLDDDKQVKYITFAVLAVIAIAFIRFEIWLFDDSWDSDGDGLSNQFEQEQGLDPDDYTWNWEWGN